MSTWKQFIVEHMKDSDVTVLPPKQRFKKLSEKYKASKEDPKKAKPSSLKPSKPSKVSKKVISLE